MLLTKYRDNELGLCLQIYKNKIYNKYNYKVLFNEYSKCIILLCNLKQQDIIKKNENYIEDYLKRLKYILYNFDDFDIFSIGFGYPICIYTINYINKHIETGNKMSKILHNLICDNVISKLAYYNLSRVSDLKLKYSLDGGVLSILFYFSSINIDNKTISYIENSFISIENTILKYIDVYGFRVPGWYIKSDDYECGYFDNSINDGVLGLLISLCIYTNHCDNNDIKSKIKEYINFIISYIFETCIVININNEVTYKYQIRLEDYLLDNNQQEYQNEIKSKIDLMISLYISGRIINDNNLISKAKEIYNEIFKFLYTQDLKLRYPKFILFERKILIDDNKSDENLKNKYISSYMGKNKKDINILFAICCNFNSDMDFIKLILLY